MFHMYLVLKLPENKDVAEDIRFFLSKINIEKNS